MNEDVWINRLNFGSCDYDIYTIILKFVKLHELRISTPL